MAEDTKGIDLGRKYGPLSGKAWLLAGVGVAAVYYIYKKIKGGSAVSVASQPGSTVLSGGGTIPTGNSVTSGAGYSTFQDWVNAAISALTQGGLSPTDAYNAVQNWINGVCLTPSQYSGLGGFLSSAGTPPGYSSSLPPLTVCGGSAGGGTTTTSGSGGSSAGSGGSSSAPGSGISPSSSSPPGAPPGLPSSIASAMIANGEHIVSTAWDPVYQDWVYLTNKGGIYNLSATGGQGNGFLGSIFNYSGNHANWYNSKGTQIRFPAKLIINPDGSYTIVDTAGETYNFTTSTASSFGLPIPTASPQTATTAPAAPVA